MNKKEELMREQLKQVTGGTGDDTRCVTGFTVIRSLVCRDCVHFVRADDGLWYCAIGIKREVDIPIPQNYPAPPQLGPDDHNNMIDVMTDGKTLLK